jgi:hypothetical protein
MAMRRALGIGLVVLIMGLGLGQQPPAKAADEVAIQAAIDKAVEALKKMQTQNGTWHYMPMAGGQLGEKDTGATAMAGLALLEADVPPNDPVITRAVNVVSKAAPSLTETYALGASIMFLDRYGDKAGGNYSGAINRMAQRLQADQRKTGGWSYGGMNNQSFEDNSNTQFAILGLWVARKHNLNVEKSLLLAEKRFRNSQDQTGGWTYGFSGPNGDPPTPTMTCAGLLGLFLGFGSKQEAKIANIRAGDKGGDAGGGAAAPKVDLSDIQTDPAVQKAMNFLTRDYVGGNLQNVGHWLYFLWSLERVCVTYGFKDCNGVDWYDWGSRFLVKYQQQNGTWTADHGATADTAFALLFLKKANLVGKIAELKTRGADKPTAGGGSKPSTGSTAKNEPPDAAEKLAQDLIKASAAKQSQLIDEYKTAKGSDYTAALGKAISKLGSGAQDKARLALIERLESKTLDSIRQYFGPTEERELRLAAVVAAGRKGKEEITPDLIPLLKDKDRAVADAAYESLKSVSGKSFDKDPAAWDAWWKGKGSK